MLKVSDPGINRAPGLGEVQAPGQIDVRLLPKCADLVVRRQSVGFKLDFGNFYVVENKLKIPEE